GAATKALPPVLLDLLKHPRAEGRLRAAQALWRSGVPERSRALPVLLELLQDPQAGNRLDAAQFLVQAGTSEKKVALPVLLDLLHNPQPDVRQQAVATIELLAPEAPNAVPALAA